MGVVPTFNIFVIFYVYPVMTIIH